MPNIDDIKAIMDAKAIISNAAGKVDCSEVRDLLSTKFTLLASFMYLHNRLQVLREEQERVHKVN